MGKRKVTILENVVETIVEIAMFVEGKGFPVAAKKFVDEVFEFFETLSEENITFKNCEYEKWKDFNYQCVSYKKKYVIAFLDLSDEVIICDFMPSKLLKK